MGAVKVSPALPFPNGSTKEERAVDWEKIADIQDADFGFDNPKENCDGIRFGVRVLLVNDRGEICVVKSEKYGYMQLPGGGIEAGESIVEALKRETEEETGWLISDIEPIGYTLERREDVRNTHPFRKDFSFVFRARPEKQVGTKYMEDEVAEGFVPVWVALEAFIAEQESHEGKIDNYSGCFSNRRDLMIARWGESMRVHGGEQLDMAEKSIKSIDRKWYV